MNDYQVVIVGGGPVGMAFGIELGMMNIKTAIIEKYSSRQMLPKAQILNPRSMEFFRRWGISQKLISKKLLPADYPLRAIWCDGLAGEIYSSIDLAKNINTALSPECYERIPQWSTEEILNNRIVDYKNVDFIRDCEVTGIEQTQANCIIKIKDRVTGQASLVTSSYVVGCDGAHSLTRQQANIEVRVDLPPIPTLSVMFYSNDLKQKMTVPKGVLYYNLTLSQPASLSFIDYENGLWYAQIISLDAEELDKIKVAELLDEIAGLKFHKEIIQINRWEMQAKLAENFRNNRIFLAGDAAHILPPTGGHGLNTGFGDVVNLSWKLAAVVGNQAGEKLLDSYESERRPVAIRNIHTSVANTQAARQVRRKCPLNTMPQEFALENARIAKQHSVSPGIALGYFYENSPVIFHVKDHVYQVNPQIYQPAAQPGFFAPHVWLANGQCLYDLLPINYVILITEEITGSGLNKMAQAFREKSIEFSTLMLSCHEVKKLYNQKYYLLRPDWHIAWCGDVIPDQLAEFIDHLMPS